MKPFRHALPLALLGALTAGLLGAPSALAAPTWLAPADLSALGQKAAAPQIAVDPGGEAVAVWVNRTTHTIQSAARLPGGSFSAPVDISVGGEEVFQPQVAINSAGEAAAVWMRRSNGVPDTVQGTTRPPGGSFSRPVDISAAAEVAFQPQIAIDAAGEAIAVWTNAPANAPEIVESATRPPGGSFSTPVNLALPAQGAGSSEPQVAISAGGEAVAVWKRFDGTSMVIQGAMRQPGAAFSAPVDLSVSAAGKDASTPQVAIDSGGEAVAVWTRSNGSQLVIQSASRASGSSVFSTAVDVSATSEDSFVPQIALDGAGNAVAVWEGSAGNNVIQSASRPPASAFSAPLDLSAGRAVFAPQIAIDPGGEAIAVWESFNGTGIVQGVSRAPGGSFSAPVDLSAAGQNASNPQVAIDAAGKAVAIWVRAIGGNQIIQAANTGDDTTTTVLCAPSAALGVATSCTATVTDTAVAPTAPRGTVKFAGNGGGSFGTGGTCTLAGAGKSSCQIAYTPGKAGPNTITASYQGDGAHLKSDGFAQLQVVTAPNTTLRKKPPKKTAQRRAVFRFASDQAGSTFQCKLDRKPFKPCHSPFKAKLKPGRHSFSVRAVSPQGLADPTPAAFRWKVGRAAR